MPANKAHSISSRHKIYLIGSTVWDTGKAHHVPGQAFQVLVELGAPLSPYR